MSSFSFYSISMFRFRVHFDGPTPLVQYGVPQATALASGYVPRSLFFASENHIYHTTVCLMTIC